MGLRDALFARRSWPSRGTTACSALTLGGGHAAGRPGAHTERRGRDRVQAAIGRPAARSTRSTASRRSPTVSTVERKSNQYGFDWLIVHDQELEEDVVHDRAHGRGRLSREGIRPAAPGGGVAGGAASPFYWIYGFKRGAFWPFVPPETRSETTRRSWSSSSRRSYRSRKT